MAELIRGKSGRVYGNLVNLLTMMKGLALTYMKDMQEDKQPIFDSCDTTVLCLRVATGMMATAKFNKQKMLESCRKGFINATDAADYLATKGIPFRDAYKVVGELVATCVKREIGLDELTIQELKKAHPAFEKDVYQAISLYNCVNKRVSYGGTGKNSVSTQIALCKKFLSV